MILSLLPNIVDKLLLIVAFSCLAQALNATGFLTWIATLGRRVAGKNQLVCFWFLVPFLLSGIFNDMTIAALLLPLVVAHANAVSFQRADLLVLAAVFGISTGGDLTVFGGNDNLAALGLLEGTEYAISRLQWSQIFVPSTLLIGMIALAICLFAARNVSWKGSTRTFRSKVDLIGVSVVCSTIVAAFFIESWALCIIAAAEALWFKVGKDLLKKLPYRALLIWTVAFVIGKLLGQYAAPHIIIPTESWLLIGVLIVATNVFTNTALMSAALPIILAAGLPASTCYAAIKAVNVAYVTIYGNSCLAVGSGYGVRQRDLLRYGLPILILSYCIIYFMF